MSTNNENKSYQVNTYKRNEVEFVKGEGVYLFDKSGNKYLDFLCGIAVTGLGHKNKKLINAAVTQIDNLWHVSNLFTSTPQENLAKKLCEKSGLDKVFFCNTGTEANEAAIKFARKFGKGKSNIITTNGGFHGRTYGSLSASAQEKLWEGFYPLTPGFVNVDYNNIDAIKNAIDENTIAVMLEPIQGENGIVIPSENYLQEVRKVCDENNLLMIMDEIQTGNGRTGKYFAYQHSSIIPDIVTMAKGIANGLPLGAVICSDKVAEAITPGSHGSTFGGNPVSISVANKVVELITPELLDNVNTVGKLFVEKIKSENLSIIKEVRAKGLMIGIEFIESIDVKNLASKLLENKVVVGTAGNNVLRILPPLIVEELHISQFINTFKSVLLIENLITKQSEELCHQN
ncbi:MAG: aspartate aminotransferase family protein [Ignavibacteriales bacterium]|nr:aspartate aminotransferase family protein [Ignavibacteriales bacterium]